MGGETEIERTFAVKVARYAGIDVWYDSKLIDDGYVGRVKDEPVTEEVDSIEEENIDVPRTTA